MVTKLCVEICWTNTGREWTLPILYLSQCRNRETIVVERRSAMVTKLCVEICWTNTGREWTLPILYLSQCRNRETIVLHVQQEM